MRQFHKLQFGMLIGLLLVLWPASGRAQASTVSWEITAGFDGSFKAGAWLPLTIAIANTGPEISGTLDVRFRTGNAGTYRQTIELPHNSNKRLVMPILSEINQDGSVQAEVSLRQGATVVRRERIDLNALGVMRLVVGVISDEGNALPELTNLRPQNDHGLGTTLLRLSSATLPERGELLQTFDVLFVHAIDPNLWTETQRRALQSWINAGGQLVVGGDLRVLQGLAELVPVTTDPAPAATTIRAFEPTGWRRRPDAPEQIPLVRLAAQPGAELALQDDAGQAVVVRQRYGMGSVTVAAFGLEALREIGDPAAFWSLALRLDVQQSPPSIQLRDQGLFALQQSLRLPARRLPSILGFLGFLLLYIVTIGPLNYVVLRRIDRREWAYLTIPLLVLLFSGGAYAWGTAGRGSSAVLSELSIVRVSQDGERGQATSLLALFSPSRHAYDLRLAPDALVADLQPPWNRQGSPPEILYAEDSTRVPELLIDVGAARALSVEHSVPAPMLEATSNASGTELILRNRSDQALGELVVGRGDGRALLVQNLAPGEERTVKLDLDRFVNEGFAGDASTIIDRQAVLNQLGGAIIPGIWVGGQVFEGPVPPEAIIEPVGPEPTTAPPGTAANRPANLRPNPASELFVLGWRTQALVEVMVDGQPTTSAGETLFVWPVRKES